MSATVSRRQFLWAGSATVLLAGCSTGGSQPSGPAPAVRPRSAAELLGSPLFHVAHRGSGDTWTEHSLDAYQRSLGAGADAVEISVTTSKDGVLVCHHDASAQRLLGVKQDIADLTWKELSALQLDARPWLGPKAPLQPISRLDDVLDALGDDFLALVEDKTGASTKALLDRLDAQPGSTSRFVWKQWARASQYQAAQERGYLTWGYLTPDIVDRAEDFVERFDALGIPTGADDADISQVVSLGRPVIAYEVHDRSSRQRLQDLGVTGMMCSNIPYLLRDQREATSDSFITGVRAFGDLPAAVDRGWNAQPLIQPTTESLLFNRDAPTSYLMGSMCPVRPEPYRVTFRMRWPGDLPDSAAHGGIAFALESDAPYVVGQRSRTSGYHAVLRAGGTMEIFQRDAGQKGAESLGTVNSDAAEPGEWMHFELLVDRDTITFTRAGDPSWVVTVEDNRRRGGYFRLGKNYSASTSLEFSSVLVREA